MFEGEKPQKHHKKQNDLDFRIVKENLQRKQETKKKKTKKDPT